MSHSDTFQMLTEAVGLPRAFEITYRRRRWRRSGDYWIFEGDLGYPVWYELARHQDKADLEDYLPGPTEPDAGEE